MGPGRKHLDNIAVRDSAARHALREWRIDRNMTQQELAEMVGVQRLTIHNLEMGKGPPELDTAISIEDHTDIRCTDWRRIDAV